MSTNIEPNSVWIAPAGSKPDSAAWTDVSSMMTVDGFEPERDAWHDAWINSPVWVAHPTAWQQFVIPDMPARTVRLIWGFSRREYRIFRGIERKQLIHNGKKPRR